jgi:hypothetical protein
MTEITVKRDSDGKVFTFYKKILPHDVTFMPYIYVYNKENDHIVLEIPLSVVNKDETISKETSSEEAILSLLKVIVNI